MKMGKLMQDILFLPTKKMMLEKLLRLALLMQFILITKFLPDIAFD